MTPKEDAFYTRALGLASLRAKLNIALQRRAEIDADIAALQTNIATQESSAATALDELVDERRPLEAK